MKLEVRIIPNASKDSISGWTDDGRMKIRIQSPPVDGAANKGLIKFLSKKAGVSKSGIRILRGETSRDKLLEIDADEDDVLNRLKDSI